MPRDDDYLPEFLEDSPFIPIGAAYDDRWEKPRTSPRPTLQELLRSKRLRKDALRVFLACVAVYLLLGIRSWAVRRWFSGARCLQTAPVVPPTSYDDGNVDWSRYAYVQYATNTEYLCNSVMIFEALQRLNSKAERVLLYPSSWDLSSPGQESRLLLKAQKDHNVHLKPIEVQSNHLAVYIWRESYTKLLAFNQTQYERIVILDSDASILQNLDELFFLSPAPAIMPHAYWIPKPLLSSHIMVLTPSEKEFARVQAAISNAGTDVYDMEIMNRLYGSSCLVLPHRGYALLSGEMRRGQHDHEAYMGPERWNMYVVKKEAKLVHFSDFPLDKPWELSRDDIFDAKPDCVDWEGQEDCSTRDFWIDIYWDFLERREAICDLG